MKYRWITVAALVASGACSSTTGTPDTGPPDVSTADSGDSGAPTDAAQDPLAAMRAACAFQAGANVRDTIGDVSAARAAIQYVIVVMQENHSTDNMFGTLGHGVEGFPASFTNPDLDTGMAVHPFHLTTACPTDQPHQWNEMHAEWDNGRLDGFAADGPNAMGYYEDADHPFYSWLATTFSTSDRYFGSVISGTWANRDYLYLGTSDGVQNTLSGIPNGTTVFDQLTAANVTWGEYVGAGGPLEGSLGWDPTHPGVHPISELLGAVGAGTLPHVTFVDEGDGVDEHPPANVHLGESAVHDLVVALFQSGLWPHVALFVTYDESGGYFDHVAPPSACLAAPSQSAFDRLGFRVPMMVVSPFARAAFVSHSTHSHTSILRFIQALYDLPALTGRDANSDAMLDLFDFTQPAFATAPTNAPAAATGTCP